MVTSRLLSAILTRSRRSGTGVDPVRLLLELVECGGNFSRDAELPHDDVTRSVVDDALELGEDVIREHEELGWIPAHIPVCPCACSWCPSSG
jgi:hypothetical protein